MVDSRRYHDWFEKAQRDLKSATILKEHNCGNDMAAFHCQQAIEKALKSYLLFKTKELQEGHSLIFLCKLSSSHNTTFKKYIKDCAFINQYYIETRYPADNPIFINDEEIEDCLLITQTILSFVFDELNINC
jgi:HEPN domain-containing protein